MDRVASAPRRLDVRDFGPDQVLGWVAASGEGELPAGARVGDAGPAAPTRWLVAYTNPRREDDVVRTVARRGFEAYLPVMTVSRRHATLARPVFPRYLFVAVRDEPGDTSYGLRETPGLEGVLRFDGALVTVPGTLVQGLRDEQDAGVYDFTDARIREWAAREKAEAEAKRVAELRPGRKVRMTGGTWLDFGGTIIEHLAGGCVSVSITLFRRTMPVPIPLANLRLVT